jgi:hypothetical protein
VAVAVPPPSPPQTRLAGRDRGGRDVDSVFTLRAQEASVGVNAHLHFGKWATREKMLWVGPKAWATGTAERGAHAHGHAKRLVDPQPPLDAASRAGWGARRHEAQTSIKALCARDGPCRRHLGAWLAVGCLGCWLLAVGFNRPVRCWFSSRAHYIISINP